MLRDALTWRGVALACVVAVGVAASYGGLRPGLLATGLSAITAVFFFTPPLFTPWVDTVATPSPQAMRAMR